MSWPKKGPNWSSSDELSMLQTRIKDMEDKNIELVIVVQVMLVRGILPCQHQTCNMWEFDPAKHQTLQELFGSSHKDIWKVLFKSSKSWPDSADTSPSYLFPNTFALVLDSNMHDLNGTNPD